MNRTQQLYQLQSLDSEIDEANEELAEIVAALGESELLKQAKSTKQNTEQDLSLARAKMRDTDLEVNGLANKISQQEKLLYSGKVSSAKEAANLQEEVASLKRWYENREEYLLEAMVTVEEIEGRLEQAEADLSTIQAQWEVDQQDLIQKQTALQTKLSELTARRPSIVDKIDGADLKDYENLLLKKAGRAVVAVKNGVCQGCRIAASNHELQKARAGVELVYCSSCGRILYVL